MTLRKLRHIPQLRKMEWQIPCISFFFPTTAEYLKCPQTHSAATMPYSFGGPQSLKAATSTATSNLKSAGDRKERSYPSYISPLLPQSLSTMPRHQRTSPELRRRRATTIPPEPFLSSPHGLGRRWSHPGITGA